MKRLDLTGQRFGRLVVRSYHGSTKDGRALWDCRCECGNTVVVRAGGLRRGTTRSCGCFSQEDKATRHITHGMTGTRVHRVWAGMLARCSNPNVERYAHYGGRGIAVFERWKSFENFYADMGDPPSGTSLDRIDNDHGYTPGNCRWASPTEQNNNRRDNTRITFDGRTLTIAEWSAELSINRGTLTSRMKRGQTPPLLFRPADISRRNSRATYVKAVLRERAKRGHLEPQHRSVLTEVRP